MNYILLIYDATDNSKWWKEYATLDEVNQGIIRLIGDYRGHDIDIRVIEDYKEVTNYARV